MIRPLLAAALMLLPIACASAPAGARPAPAARAVHPVSGLEVVPLTVTHGKKHFTFRVEVARTSSEQARGLMFRERMGPNEGMIFPMRPPRYASFWMRNTLIPLDIVFIGQDGRILNIAAQAVPHDESPIPSYGIAAAVLELNGGRAAQLGIVPGDKVEW